MESEFSVCIRGNITSYLNSELDFQSQHYEVCLQDILIGARAWNNVWNGRGTIILALWNVDRRYLNRIDFELSNQIYHSPNQLIADINNAMKQALRTNPPKYYSGYDSAGVAILTVAHWEIECRFDFLEKTNNYMFTSNYKDATLLFNKNLAYVLGIIPTLAYNPKPIEMSFLLDDSIDLSRNYLAALWIYADFTIPIMMGSECAPLLAVVPVNSFTAHVEYKLLSRLFYTPVQARKFKVFNVVIYGDHERNQPLNINNDVILSMHFMERLPPIRHISGFPVIVTISDNTSVKLNTDLNFSYPHEVTLQDVHIPGGAWNNVRIGRNYGEIIPIDEADAIRFTIPPEHYNDNHAFLLELSLAMHNALILANKTFSVAIKPHKADYMITFKGGDGDRK